MGRKDPVNLYYSITLNLGNRCVGSAGDREAGTPVFVEPLLKYDPLFVWILTRGTGTLIGG